MFLFLAHVSMFLDGADPKCSESGRVVPTDLLRRASAQPDIAPDALVAGLMLEQIG